MKRVLIIGTGSIGERHLRCFQATGKFTVAACEPNPELGQTVASRYGCAWYPSLEEACKAESFDAAVICTPAHTHIAIARDCVARGLNLLIEKPLAVTREGIDELSQEAATAGVVIRVAYIHRVMATNALLRHLLGSGVIGEPKHVTLVSGQNFPFFRPAYRTIYYAKHEMGGGAIQDALTHSLHGVAWILGSRIERVAAQAGHQVLEGVEVEDTVNLAARFDNGVMASFAINQFQLPNESFLSIHGTKGSLRAELHNRRVGIFKEGAETWEWTELPVADRDTPFIAQAEAFLAALRGDAEQDVLSSLADADQTLRVNIAALESNRSGREVCIAK